VSTRVPTTADSPTYDQVSDLGRRLYRLGFRYNARDGSWYLSVATQGGTALAEGRKLRIDWDTLRQFSDARLPDGVLSLPDADGSRVEPGRDDLGSRLHLTFDEA